MIKLIVTDIDGTLFHSDNTQPPELEKILKELKNNHIMFAVASGRPYLTLLKTFDSNKDFLYIAENGAHIVYRDKELSVELIDQTKVDRIIEITRHIPSSHAVVCTTAGAYIECCDPDFIQELEKFYVKYTIVPDLTKINKKVVKVAICDLNGTEKNSYPHFGEFKDTLQISIAGFVWMDFMPKGVNKGKAIDIIRDAFQIKDKEIMAFGDYLNDAEMLQNVYYSYAMENSHPKLFKAARFKAASNDNDGVILKIKDMLNNQLVPVEGMACGVEVKA
jgi:Cof subfamily protein (haloacid dehalogenase superfamily)